MPKFSTQSLRNLRQCDIELQFLFSRVIERFDCSVLCGHRTKDAQMQAYREGKSKLTWPNSKHNSFPSQAVDVAPWPIDWSNGWRFKEFGFYVMGVADSMGIMLRWGGDWNRNLKTVDNHFEDLVHFELIRGDENGKSIRSKGAA